MWGSNKSDGKAKTRPVRGISRVSWQPLPPLNTHRVPKRQERDMDASPVRFGTVSGLPYLNRYQFALLYLKAFWRFWPQIMVQDQIMLYPGP